MEAEHNGSASQLAVCTIGANQEPAWEDQKARVLGWTRCWVARHMAQWAASEDNEWHQGLGATNTPIQETLPSSNDIVPHPLMDCGQGKISNNGNNGPATGRGSDEGSGDMEIGQDSRQVGRASDGDEDATGSTVYVVPIAIVGVNYPIAGAPHPINKLVRLHKCESIPPPHGATPPSSGQQLV